MAHAQVNTRTITHHLKGSWFPNMIGTDLIRFYEFSGDRLIVTTPKFMHVGKESQYVLVWVYEK
jgi:hypothetical protein